MSESQDIALIDELRGLPAETEWLEFKRNRYESQQIGEYLSALANSMHRCKADWLSCLWY